MMMWTKRPTNGERGYSLVELLIAMVILAIGILATMAMQYTALAGYTSARELTGSTEVARTVEQMIRAEAQGMEMDQMGASPTGAFDVGSEGLLEAALSQSNLGQWVLPAGWETPMTQRLNPGGTDDGARRYCVYVAGELISASGEALEDDGDGGLTGTPDYARVGIAVVYPGANAHFTGAGQGDAGTCDDAQILNSLDSGNREQLELLGLRVTHLSMGVGAQNRGGI